jgi:hypothetical protein
LYSDSIVATILSKGNRNRAINPPPPPAQRFASVWVLCASGKLSSERNFIRLWVSLFSVGFFFSVSFFHFFLHFVDIHTSTLAPSIVSYRWEGIPSNNNAPTIEII